MLQKVIKRGYTNSGHYNRCVVIILCQVISCNTNPSHAYTLSLSLSSRLVALSIKNG